MYKKIIFLASFVYCVFSLNAQIVTSTLPDFDYANPKEYEIGGITISGIKFLDQDVLINLTGLQIGDTIPVPGEDLTKAIEKLWKQNLFSDIKITATRTIENKIFLDFYLLERPRLARFSFNGIKKGEADDIREKINLVKGAQVTDNILMKSTNTIKSYFIEKGFLNVEVEIKQQDDTAMQNHIILDFDIKKNNKVKIFKVDFQGNTVFTERQLLRAMKNTKQKNGPGKYNIFRTSKFIEENFRDDKNKIIAKYNEKGYRDAKIVLDSVSKYDDRHVQIKIKIDEGHKYFFRNIAWVGNTKYKADILNAYLGIKKGDIFNQALLDEKLFIDQNGVSSLYLDDGYLFFSVTPVEVKVENDSIDLEMRIYEGRQAIVNNIIITGNTKTNEHVVRREIRTKPGQLFNRSDIIRSQRELAQLGYFNPEKLDVNPTPNMMDGTVDIEYIVEEKPSDQIELSGGWGANMIVGTLGVSFNNFSARNFFKKDAWRPLPSGDGQRLSIRAQSNGMYYQAYSASFVEPWLGGKKPNSLSVSVYHTIQTNGYQSIDSLKQFIHITGVSTGLGRRLKWPDDFFTLYNELSFQRYDLKKWSYFIFNTGTAKNLSFSTTFGRNSIDQPIYPRKGSMFSLSLNLTPPYSLLINKDWENLPALEKYEWIEYHKWTFSASWFTRLAGDLVLNTKANFGFLGMYNKKWGHSPFEGFTVGGDGLSGYNLYGRDVVSLRGYDNGSLTPDQGGNLYNKLTMELRYPLTLNPNATLYALTFLEGGNCWYDFKNYNPFDIKRSAGIGIRIFLPMIGMLGVDWGWGFDDIPGKIGGNKSQFHFVLGQQF
ncbi:MAG: outer membrane protein assembly factor BamA [Bacteroidetes bacterium RIFOXYA12_FULL_35_11]|nr:MAG: outer membrane protein assembly factor BamA [Bacteroidetes bacterium GWF2_35_48]OFY78892.1 MAG: outer membrane protein assembly factor BamA [Bacteroidetes bacterium RIFOXYA12_FULL_35_11]HBX53625.1 outer membrane protein assembly factor BamA [Bacteroidales bacterium]